MLESRRCLGEVRPILGDHPEQEMALRDLGIQLLALRQRETLFDPAHPGVIVLLGRSLMSHLDEGRDVVVGTIAAGDEPVGIAVALVSHRVYVANVVDVTVSMLDGESGGSPLTILAGRLPMSLAINPATSRLYVANEGDRTLMVAQDQP